MRLAAVCSLALLSLASTSGAQGRLTAKQVYAKCAASVVKIQSDYHDDDGEMATSTGSGFIVFSDDVIVTAYHVIERAESITVKDDRGKVLPVSMMAVNPGADIAVLWLNGHSGRAPILYRHFADVTVGDVVFTIGDSLGLLANSLSQGIVSGKRKVNGLPLVQTTAPISKGNSGGPLLNEEGIAVGVIKSYLVNGQNLNMAVAMNEVTKTANDASMRISPASFAEANRTHAAPQKGDSSTPQAPRSTQGIDLNPKQLDAMGEALKRSLEGVSLSFVKKVRVYVDQPEEGRPTYDSSAIETSVELELRRTGIATVLGRNAKPTGKASDFPDHALNIEIQVMKISSVGGADRGYCGHVTLKVSNTGYSDGWKEYGDLELYSKGYLFVGSDGLQSQLAGIVDEMVKSFCLAWLKQNEKS